MSQPGDIKSVEDLKKLKVPELKDFLNAQGIRVSGLRQELLHHAELYFDALVIRTPTASSANRFDESLYSTTWIVRTWIVHFVS